MMNVEEFCKKHAACEDGYERNKHFEDMDDFFENSEHHEDVIWAACNVLTENERMRFACWCVRHVWHLLADERSRKAVEVAEDYCEGNATKKELKKERAAADAAAFDAAWAALAAPMAATCATYAARAAPMAARAATCATCAATDATCATTAASAAMAAAWATDATDAARAAQVKYLRENFKPDWNA